MKKIQIPVLFLILILPFASFAYSDVDRDDLDDEIVEKFPIPVLFGVDYEDINPDFGDLRSDGRSHEGEDILALKGTPVISPTEAIVIKTGDSTNSGKHVYTANPGGETFRYMHLDEVANLNKGDKLDVGDYIGTVGDTGNAPDGVYHLHFEVRDEGNDPLDPYDRIDEKGFTLKEKVSFLRDVFRKRSDDKDYAEFLVETFHDEMEEAFEKEYNLPNDIDDALEDTGFTSKQKLLTQFEGLIKSLPKVLNLTLQNGDSGQAVALFQVYLIYAGDGPARDALRAAGPTGYYGSITKNALAEYQREYLLIEDKGVYDAVTRDSIMKYGNINMNFN